MGTPDRTAGVSEVAVDSNNGPPLLGGMAADAAVATLRWFQRHGRRRRVRSAVH